MGSTYGAVTSTRVCFLMFPDVPVSFARDPPENSLAGLPPPENSLASPSRRGCELESSSAPAASGDAGGLPMRLFSGQRYEEVARLRVGCSHWRNDGATIAGDSNQVLARDAV